MFCERCDPSIERPIACFIVIEDVADWTPEGVPMPTPHDAWVAGLCYDHAPGAERVIDEFMAHPEDESAEPYRCDRCRRTIESAEEGRRFARDITIAYAVKETEEGVETNLQARSLLCVGCAVEAQRLIEQFIKDRP